MAGRAPEIPMSLATVRLSERHLAHAWTSRCDTKIARSRTAEVSWPVNRGMRGTTQLCLEALASYLQESREEGLAILLSGPRDKYKCRSHAFLLTVEGSPELLISDGFSSGYMGEGPHGLISVISILETSGWDINEVTLGEALFERLCAGLATWDDLGRILKRRRQDLNLRLLRPERSPVACHVTELLDPSVG
jgi:hypothetical protein